MRRVTRSSISCLVAIGLSISLLAQTAAPVSIEIYTDGQVFKEGSEVKLHITIQNTSNHAVMVSSGTGAAEGGGDAEIDNAIQVRDGSGSLLPRVDEQIITNPNGKLTRPSGFHSRRGYNLQPGEKFRDSAVLSHLFDLSKPGVYTVTVLQDFPLDESNPHTALSTATSNTLQITILGSPKSQ